jgi:hypothetical protein
MGDLWIDDAALTEALAAALDRPIASLTRRPHRYATSAPLEALSVTLTDGRELDLLLKVLGHDRLRGDARAAKPSFLYDPRRDIEMYRTVLGDEGIGARCYAAVVDELHGRYWLVLEQVPGVELWQVGDLAIWEQVAGWLARFHLRFADRVDEVRAAVPCLLDYDADLLRAWPTRVVERLGTLHDERLPALRRLLERYDRVVDALAQVPPTLVHGEFYPSNVLVHGSADDLRVYPVDWEMAATGPGLLDLAALVEGWDPASHDRLVATYHAALVRDGGSRPPSVDQLSLDLDRCRLHLALQWIGWAPDWQPPDEHAHDWVGVALGLGDRLGLLAEEVR